MACRKSHALCAGACGVDWRLELGAGRFHRCMVGSSGTGGGGKDYPGRWFTDTLRKFPSGEQGTPQAEYEPRMAGGSRFWRIQGVGSGEAARPVKNSHHLCIISTTRSSFSPNLPSSPYHDGAGSAPASHDAPGVNPASDIASLGGLQMAQVVHTRAARLGSAVVYGRGSGNIAIYQPWTELYYP